MDRERHRRVMRELLEFINRAPDSPYILKGGTSLMACYGLDRFSEDIGLDCPARSRRGGFAPDASMFCDEHGYEFGVGKDTPTVSRVFIDYGDSSKPLKVEVSYRRKEIPAGECVRIGGIKVYTISAIAFQKASAYQSRDKIRDLYDVTFIVSRYLDALDEGARSALRAALEYKDIEQFDYVVRTQPDPLIDTDKLAEAFLDAFDKLGLLGPEEASQQQQISSQGQADKSGAEKAAGKSQAAPTFREAAASAMSAVSLSASDISARPAARGRGMAR